MLAGFVLDDFFINLKENLASYMHDHNDALLIEEMYFIEKNLPIEEACVTKKALSTKEAYIIKMYTAEETSSAEKAYFTEKALPIEQVYTTKTYSTEKA